MRDREFLKGKERLTQVFGTASAGRPLLKETTHNFTVSFFDYGATPLSGLFRAWNYEHEKIETTWDGSNSLSKRTAYIYDESDTNYGYDRLDRLTSVVDANSNLTTMAYDALVRKVSMSEPNMGAWSYAYDTNGKLVRQTDAKNHTITYSYDALGRLIAKGTTLRS